MSRVEVKRQKPLIIKGHGKTTPPVWVALCRYCWFGAFGPWAGVIEEAAAHTAECRSESPFTETQMAARRGDCYVDVPLDMDVIYDGGSWHFERPARGCPCCGKR